MALQDTHHVHVQNTVIAYQVSSSGQSIFELADASNVVLDSVYVLYNSVLNSDTASTVSFLRSSNIVVQNSAFQDNSAGSGGALGIKVSSQISLDSVVFSANSATVGNGGALTLRNCTSMAVTNCQFTYNVAALHGGALFVQNVSALSVSSILMEYNVAGSDGAGFSAQTSSNIVITNAVFGYNNAGGAGGALFFDTVSASEVSHTRLYSNNATSYGGGFLITSGTAVVLRSMQCRSNLAGISGGCLAVTSSQYLTMNFALVEDNVANTLTGQGGGLYLLGSSFVNISSFVCRGNRAQVGGGLSVDEDNNMVMLSTSAITENMAETSGGGIYVGSNNYGVVILPASAMATQEIVPLRSLCGGQPLTFTNRGDVKTLLFMVGNYVVRNTFTWTISGLPYSASDINPFTITNDPSLVTVAPGRSESMHFSFSNNFTLSGGSCDASDTLPVVVIFSVQKSAAAASEQSLLSTNWALSIDGVSGGGGFHIGTSNNAIAMDSLAFYDNRGAFGGAINIVQENEYICASNLAFVNNRANGNGGAISTLFSNAHIDCESCLFQNNSALSRGGAWAISSGNVAFQSRSGESTAAVRISNSIFASNHASNDGGAIHVNIYNFISIANTTIVGGYSQEGEGGGVYLSDRNELSVDSSVIKYNRVMGGNGGGIYLLVGNTLSMSDSEISYNAASEQGGGLTVESSNVYVIKDTVIFGNVAGVCGGGVADLLINQFTYENLVVRDNAATVGGGQCFATTYKGTMLSNVVFQQNTALAFGGAIALVGAVAPVQMAGSGGPLDLIIRGNAAPRGSAIFLGRVENFAMYNVLVTANYASIGGTVFWVYQSVPEPQMISVVNSPSAVFQSNTAGYGAVIGTQAVALSGPVNMTVTSYQEVFARIAFNLYDVYEQRIPNEDMYASMSILSSQCGGLIPIETYIGSDNGLFDSQGQISFPGLRMDCAPQGKIESKFTAMFPESLVPTEVATLVRIEDFSIHTNLSFHYRACTPGEVIQQERYCYACEEGTYVLGNSNNNSTSQTCSSCRGVSGIRSCRRNEIELEQGYWRWDANTQAVLTCRYASSSCVGGLGTGDGVCATGYEGPLCAVCSQGYFQVDGGCEICSSSNQITGGVVLLIVLLFMALLGVALYLNADSFSSDFMWKMFDVCADVLPSAVTKLKIILATFQITSNIPVVLRITLPALFMRYLRALEVLNLSFSSLFPFACSIQLDYLQLMMITTLVPIALTLLLLVAYLGESALINYFAHVQRMRDKYAAGIAVADSHDINRRILNRYLNAWFYLTYLVLPSITTTLFRVFNCTDIDPYDEHTHEDTLYLTADMSISCQSSYYRSWLPYVFVMIAVYPVAIPISYFLVLYRHRHEIQERDDLRVTPDPVVSKSSKAVGEAHEPEEEKHADRNMSFSSAEGDDVDDADDEEYLRKPGYDNALFRSHSADSIVDKERCIELTSVEQPSNASIAVRKSINNLPVDQASSSAAMDQQQASKVSSLASLITSTPLRRWRRNQQRRRSSNSHSHSHNPVNLDRSIKVNNASELDNSIEGGKKDEAGVRAVDCEDMSESQLLLQGTSLLSIEVEGIAFLWVAYEPRYWYWEVIETLRRICLTAVLSILSPGTPLQTVLSILFTLCFMQLYGSYAPYDDPRDDWLSDLGHIQVFLTFFAALILRNDLIHAEYFIVFLGIALVALNVLLFIVLVYLVTVSLHEVLGDVEEEGKGSRRGSQQRRGSKESQQSREDFIVRHHDDRADDHVDQEGVFLQLMQGDNVRDDVGTDNQYKGQFCDSSEEHIEEGRIINQFAHNSNQQREPLQQHLHREDLSATSLHFMNNNHNSQCHDIKHPTALLTRKKSKHVDANQEGEVRIQLQRQRRQLLRMHQTLRAEREEHMAQIFALRAQLDKQQMAFNTDNTNTNHNV